MRTPELRHAPRMTPLSDRALTARCLRRFVRGAFGAPKMRQRHGLQVSDRLPNTRQPIIGSAARDTWKCGHKIGGGETEKLFSECHDRHSKPQRKIRNAENRACVCPQCGHNDRTMKIKLAAATVEEAITEWNALMDRFVSLSAAVKKEYQKRSRAEKKQLSKAQYDAMHAEQVNLQRGLGYGFMSIYEVCDRCGVPYSAIQRRESKGWWATLAA